MKKTVTVCDICHEEKVCRDVMGVDICEEDQDGKTARVLADELAKRRVVNLASLDNLQRQYLEGQAAGQVKIK